MREFINLITEASSWYDDEEEDEDEYFDYDEDDSPEMSTSGYDFGKLREFYRNVKQTAESHMGCGSDVTYDAVEEWVETHRQLFQPGKINVFRTMTLNPSFVESLTPGTELGQHWTYEFDEYILDNFDIGGEKYQHATKGEARLYVFEAEIKTNDVDFPLTVAYNCVFPHEKEIFLPMNATPKLVGIYEYDVQGGMGGRVRDDLIGQTFKV